MKYTKELCIALITARFESLGTLPKKSDFTPEEVMAIKSFLGPWPRALEAAGVKPPRDGSRELHNREKRIRAKRKRIEIMKNERKKQNEIQ